jgi:imidazolonepropionase-like amidohydrolase
MNRTVRCAAAIVAAAGLRLAAPAAGAPVAYTNATLHPIVAPAIPNGTLVVDGGAIVAVGAEIALPEGAAVIDLGGRHVWPGLVDAASDLGLTEIGAVRATNDYREIGDWNPDLRTEIAFHPDSRRIPPALAGGVTTVHVVPESDLFAGTSAVVRLDGWTWEEMTLAAPVGQHLYFPRVVRPTASWFGPPPEEEEFEKEKKEKLRKLDERIAAAKGYERARSAAEAGTGPAIDIDPRFEALRPLLAGRMPLFLWAEERNQIAQALDWAKKHGFARLVLVAGPDAALHAERLAAEKVPVVLLGVHRLPERSWEPYDAPFTAAARLHAAGVELAIAATDSSNERNLPFQVATAVAHGLPREAGHAAMTVAPARILGIDDRAGALAPGREASFFVADGDPLDIRTSIVRVFVRGREIDLAEDPQRRLWERYRARPTPAN